MARRIWTLQNGEAGRWETCDCGTRHWVPEVFIGTCGFWKCNDCLDGESKAFEAWFATAIVKETFTQEEVSR